MMKEGKGLTSGIKRSAVSLLNTGDELSMKNIRISHLAYSLPLVIVLTLLDQRNTYFALSDSSIADSGSAILIYAAYCAGSLSVLLFGMKKKLEGLRCCCALGAAGFVCWLFLQQTDWRMTPMAVFQFGLGGCAIYAVYSYVFVLRNAERLFGILLVTFNYGFFVFLQQNGINNIFLSKVLPALFVALLAVCVALNRREDYPDTSVHVALTPPKSLFIILACPFAFFSINVFGEAVISHSAGNADMRGVGAMTAVLMAFLILFVLKQNVWCLINLFLIFCLVGIAMLALQLPSHWLALLALQLPSRSLSLGNFLFGIGDGFGYILIFYLTGMIKKYKSERLFFQITAATVVELMVSIGAAYGVQYFFPGNMPVAAVLLAAFFLFLFLFFAPQFQKHIFAADWIKDYHKLDMTPADQELFELSAENKPLPNDLFYDFIRRARTLTPTERQIFEHYVNGKSAQEVMEMMFITMGTLKAHNTKIYTKMNVTSRDALMLYIELIQKSGLSFD